MLLLVWDYLRTNLCSGIQKTRLFRNRVRFGRSRLSKVDDFGRLPFESAYATSCLSPIVTMATYWLKLPIFATFLLLLSHSAPSLPMSPLEFRAEVNHRETRVMWLSSSEDRMIVAGVVLAG